MYSCGYFPLYGDFRGDYTLGAFRELDCGFDFYAPQTFSDGGRRLLIGWMGMPDADYANPTVANGWQHCLTVPCEIKRDGERMLRVPAREISALRGEHIPTERAQVFDMVCRTEAVGRLVIRGAAVVEWDGQQLSLTLVQGGAGRNVRYADVGAVKSLRVLADTSSLEIFINGGEQVMTTRYYPDPASCGVQMEGAQAEIWAIGALQIQ